jgi:chitinase
VPELSDTLYTAPFSVDQTTTVKARARIGGALWSGTRTVTFEIRYAAPTFVPSSGGPYTSVTTVTISAPVAGAAVYYTTDGSEPTTASGALYVAAFTVDETTTVKARALINGHVWGALKTVEYKVHYNAPTLTPSSGTYAAGKTITITHTVAGAQLYYTLNGSEPTTASPLYGGPVPLTVPGAATLKARALIHGHVWGATKTGAYTITSSGGSMPAGWAVWRGRF